MSITEPRDLMDVLARLDHSRHEPTTKTMRHYKRYSVRGEARLESLDPTCVDPSITVLLRDVSRAGIGFLVDQILEPGSMWRVQLRTRDFVIGSVAIIVRYCRAVQSDLYLCGGQVVIEPYLLNQLGIPPEQARNEELCNFDKRDTSAFSGNFGECISPDDLFARPDDADLDGA
ncbi:hypothetical protein HED60_11870 [Planctomycetales bacterium ZRK34]|nr:hypothetical protein HED60_11870 [Planctomycetales bacterium ZRK34]